MAFRRGTGYARGGDMPKIGTDALVPGMKLAKPVMGQNNMVLLAQGTELNEKLINRLDDMGVDGVFVEGPSEQAVSLDEALASLEKRFAAVQDKPHMGLIKRVVRKHIESLYS